MHLHMPTHPNDVLVVLDQRTKYDAELSTETDVDHVGAGLGLMRHMIGSQWDRCTRLALYDYGTKPSPKDRAAARKDYKRFLDMYQPKVMVVLPTPSKAMAQNNTVQGTQVWKDLTPPDALDDMRGTFWRRGEMLVLPAFWPVGTIGQVNIAFMNRWMRAAVTIAAGKAKPQMCGQKFIQVGSDMEAALYSLKDKPIAVDIETIPGQEVITAIGVSDGVTSVSVPFDGFEAACGSGYSPPLSSYRLGPQLRSLLGDLLAAPTPKVLHNMGFDLPQLAKRGFPMGGNVYDTLAMHAINYPEARHGLQLACASELIIPPWKSLFHPKGLKRDQPEFWYWDPDTMRDYNADDAFYTMLLANQSAWKLGITLT